MKFFDKAYVEHEVDSTARQKAYRKHLRRLRRLMPPSLIAQVEHVKFHDAVLERLLVDSRRREVRLEVFCNEWGPDSRAVLIYRDAQLIGTTAARRIVGDRKSEILYDELDVDGETCIHRFLFWPRLRELEIRFHDLSCEQLKDLPKGARPRKATFASSMTRRDGRVTAATGARAGPSSQVRRATRSS
jgi:hypothetical protein